MVWIYVIMILVGTRSYQVKEADYQVKEPDGVREDPLTVPLTASGFADYMDDQAHQEDQGEGV